MRSEYAKVRVGPWHEVAALQPAAREQEPRGREPGEKIVVAMESSRPENRVLQTSLRKELPMSDTNTVSPLRQRMIEDMAARKLNPHTQRSHIYSCKRLTNLLKNLGSFKGLWQPLAAALSYHQ